MINIRLADNESFAVYEWLTWGEFLVLALAPRASLISAEVDDSVERVVDALPHHTTAFLFHINCSVTINFPLVRQRLLESLHARRISVLNSGVTDISKRRVHEVLAATGLSSALASPSGDPDELIFVKTNWNSAGNSEQQLTDRQRSLLGFRQGHPSIRDSEEYMVLRRKDIAASWWSDLDLILERYITNEEHRWYRAFFFLSRLCICELLNVAPVKKVRGSTVGHVWRFSVGNGTIQGHDPDFPAAMARDLVRFQTEFGLDFGAVDLVQDDIGQHYIVDVNSTPAFTVKLPHVVEHLRLAFAR